jgi:hypothetical protein
MRVVHGKAEVSAAHEDVLEDIGVSTLQRILYGGRYETLFSAPRQSEMISALPFIVGLILFTLRSMR